MPYEVHDDLIDQIWCDLGRQVARPRVVEVAREIAADLCDATVPGYVPLFVRRLACERLSREAGPQQQAALPQPEAKHAR